MIDITKVNFCRTKFNGVILLPAQRIAYAKDTCLGFKIESCAKTYGSIRGIGYQGRIFNISGIKKR